MDKTNQQLKSRKCKTKVFSSSSLCTVTRIYWACLCGKENWRSAERGEKASIFSLFFSGFLFRFVVCVCVRFARHLLITVSTEEYLIRDDACVCSRRTKGGLRRFVHQFSSSNDWLHVRRRRQPVVHHPWDVVRGRDQSQGMHVPGMRDHRTGLLVDAQGRRVDASRAGGRLTVGLAVLAVRVLVAALPAPVLAVGLDVLGQVIRPHEPLVADRAGEPLLARVGPEMPLELVRPGEPLPAEEPVADEGTLSRVPTEVGLQVGGLAVDLSAAGDVTAVDVALSEVLACGTEAFGLLTIGAVAGGATGVTTLVARRGR